MGSSVGIRVGGKFGFRHMSRVIDGLILSAVGSIRMIMVGTGTPPMRRRRGAGSSITMAVGYGTTISAGCGCRAVSGAPDGSIGGAAVGILVGRHYRRMRLSSKSETCHGTGFSSSHSTFLNRGLRHS